MDAGDDFIWRPVPGRPPIPPVPCNLPAPKMLFPFDLMEVGEAIDVKRSAHHMRSLISQFNRHHPDKAASFVTRSTGNKSCRVWKVSDAPPPTRKRGRPRKKAKET